MLKGDKTQEKISGFMWIYVDLCGLRRNAYSGVCRTGFRFLPDTVPIDIGQCSGVRSDSFRAPLEWCPGWAGMVSERNRKPEPGGEERRWNKCPGRCSMQLNGRLMARTKLTMRQIQELLRLKHQNQL